MACLRLSIGCFAVIGLIVVALVVGAVLLLGVGIAQAVDLPERAGAERLAAAYADRIAQVRTRLEAGDLRDWKPPAGLIAVRERRGRTDDGADRDLLSGAPLAWSSHTMLNGGSVATIDRAGGPQACLIYELRLGSRICWLYFADPGPVPAGPE